MKSIAYAICAAAFAYVSTTTANTEDRVFFGVLAFAAFLILCFRDEE